MHGPIDKPPQPPVVLTFAQIAREELIAADGDRDKAVASLEKRIESDPALRKTIASEAIDIAMTVVVRKDFQTERSAILNAVGAGREGVKALATGIMRTVLDMPLFDGTKLRDCSLEDLQIAVKHYTKQAERMKSMAWFLNAVIKMTPPDKTVGDVLTDDAANKLWRKYVK